MIVITGGAGFIGSHIARYYIAKGRDVISIDNLSSGKRENAVGKLFVADICSDISRYFKNAEIVFHYAADPDVRSCNQNPRRSFEINVRGTINVLEACRKHDVKHVVLASTSTVYGEAKIPTPETHPTFPISVYGASKLAAEGYIAAYAGTYGIKGTVIRYANIFGPGSSHGVMFDFFQKLRKNQKELEILGDGRQSKSYLYIDDCISATTLIVDKQTKNFGVFNVGSDERVSVIRIARLVSSALGLKPKFKFTGGRRGWAGDVSLMLLSTKKLKALGWKPRTSFEEGVKKYVGWLREKAQH
ncbi:MAG: NAD-dependent epimerase/dehydratase family protein [Candidatus Micrarchaeia archaeon]